MKENADFSELDSFMINNLINILNQNFNGKQSKRSLSKIHIINYIFENGDLPLKCRIRMIVDVFILEYIEIEKNESNIINLKDKWANIIITNCEFTSNDKERIYKYLENRIIYSNKIGLEVQKKRMLKTTTFKLNIHKALTLNGSSNTPKFNILVECISDFNPKLAFNILDKLAINLYFFCYEKGLKDYSINEILDSQKGVYYNKFGLIPRIKDFVSYLLNYGLNYGINPFSLPETTIEELLTDYVIDKLEIIDINIEKAKNKKQTLIETKPHQTLSIETTTANVEDGNLVLQHQEIGLLHYYDGLPLNDNNAQRIAEKYGQGSGVTLMRHYRAVSNSQSQRRNHKHAKKYLETVIPLLTKKEGIEEAKQDLANVKTR